MSHNKLYRNFIILQEDKKECLGEGDKPLSGYAKIEARNEKCTISFYAQNLRKDDDYYMVLICYKKDIKKIVDLGSLKVDKVGKGESLREYYISDIGGMDLAYDKISGAGLCKYSDGKPRFIMYGFINGESVNEDWKNLKISKCNDSYQNVIEKDKKKLTKDIKKKEEEDKKEYKEYKQEKVKEEHKDKEKYNKDNIYDSCKDEKHEDYDKHEDHEKYEEKHHHDEYDKHEEHDKHEDHHHEEYDKHDDHHYKEHKDECEECRSEKIEGINCEDPCFKRGESPITFDEYESIIDQRRNSEIEIELVENNNEDILEELNHKPVEDNIEKREHTYNYETSPSVNNIENNTSEKPQSVREVENNTYEKPRSMRGVGSNTYEKPQSMRVVENTTQTYRNDYKDFDLKGSLGEFFKNISEGLDECKGLFREIKYCKWYKVKINSLDDMCNVSDYNKYNIIYYPMLSYFPYIKKYGYFMIGFKCNSLGYVDYIVYGIPGSRDEDDQPYAGKTGFVTWTKDKSSAEGCWFMFYDYKKSTVVIPTKQ